MAVIRPFRAVRPRADLAAAVAALPYDVMNEEEARAMCAGAPYSFLHIDRAECDLPEGTDPYSDAVYKKAASTLKEWKEEGIFIKDDTPCFYVYQLTMDGRTQTGLTVCCAAADYENGHIKKHELTRADKEEDRVRHVDTCNANTGPIFLCYRENPLVSGIIRDVQKEEPVYDFVAEDGIGHKVWVINDARTIKTLQNAAEASGDLYIADGHHRCASACRVAKMRREAAITEAERESDYFLAVLFPDTELKIYDYNRVVADLNGCTPEEFLAAVSRSFSVLPAENAVRPSEKGTFGLYLDGKWYRLSIRDDLTKGLAGADALDVSLLQNHVFSAILGIHDPKTDSRIDFVGGIRGWQELERRVHADCEAAFLMYPTSIGELFAVADAGLLMPPKSTWFEPKLRSGLYIHLI